MTTNKLKPSVGDVWRFRDDPPVTIQTLYYGFWSTEDMLSDPRWVLVRPAGCPEGFVACTRGCGRWTKRDKEDEVICWKCAAGGESCSEQECWDWIPPAYRVIDAPAVPPASRGATSGRIFAETDEHIYPGGARSGVFRLVPDSPAVEKAGPVPVSAKLPCYAIGPDDSRCLRDQHDDNNHRFGFAAHWPV